MMQLGGSTILRAGGLFFGPRTRTNSALALLGEEKGLAVNYMGNSFAERDVFLDLGQATEYGTFSRSGAGTYLDRNRIWRTAGTDVLRLTHDPVTGEPLGALLEGARAEPVRQSANMSPSSSVWSSSAIFAAVNPKASVFAGATAWEHVADGVTSRGRFVGVTVDVSTNYRASIIVEDTDNPADKVTFGLYKNGDSSPWRGLGDYDWAANALTQRQGNISDAKVYDWGVGPNGGRLRRLSFLVNSGAAGADRFFVYPNSVGVPLAGQSTIIHHASLSPLPYDTSPIITGDAAGFQAADSMSFARPGTPEGTVVIRGRTAAGVGNSDQCIWQWDDGTRGSRYYLVRTPQRRIAFLAKSADVEVAKLANLGVVADDTVLSVAVSFKAAEMAGSLNGAAPVIVAPTGALPTVSTMRVGSDIAVYPWQGTVASLRLTPRATDLSDLPGLLS